VIPAEVARPATNGPASRHHRRVHPDVSPAVTAQPSAVPRFGGTLVWAVAVLGIAASVATLLVDVRTPDGTPGARLLAPEPGWWALPEALALTGCAAVVLRHDVRDRVGWAMAGFGAFWALDGLAQSWTRYGVRHDDLLPGAQAAFWFVDRVGAFLPVGVALLFLLYPTGRMLPGRWGRAGRVALALMCLAATAVVLGPAREVPGASALPAGLDLNPTQLGVDPGVMSALVRVLAVAAALSVVVPVSTVAVRYRGARGDDQHRMRWLLWGLLAELVVVAVATALGSSRLSDLVFSAVVVVPAAAVTVGLVRPRLVPVDALLTSTLVYGALGAVVVGLDLLAVAALGAALGDAVEQRQVVVVVLLASALGYGPLRERFRRLARRLVLGQREDRYDLVAGLASRLEAAAGADAQLAAVASAVATGFAVPFVGVEVDRPGSERLVVTHGRRPDRTRSLPISYRDEVVGRLVLPASGVRAHLSSRDEQLLGDLVRQAATAARTGRLADELQETRENLVLAREEERRRIRRDLHDGLGPALSAVVFRVEAARMQLARQATTAAAGEALVLVRDDVQRVISDVRRLVHDLRPPALDDLGLVGALREQAEAACAGGLTVEVRAEGVGLLPAAVEVAAYRIIGEAMTNTVRHAGASTCRVELAVHHDELRIEVADDGCGIAADAVSGIGLCSLRERAAELGGSTEITCPGSGTRVRARLPLRSRG